MLKILKKLIIILLFIPAVSLAGSLETELKEKCVLQISGDSCSPKINVINNSGKKLLNGKAYLHINFNGNDFDGKGVNAQFRIGNSGLLNASSGFINGNLLFEGFEIEKGVSFSEVNINTNPALYPGDYKISLKLKGEKSSGETVEAQSSIGGMGGSVSPESWKNQVFNEKSLETKDYSTLISWQTNYLSTSRVIYDEVSHPSLGDFPNYGYKFSTKEDATKKTNHLVLIADLKPGTKYYYRCISKSSPEVVGEEFIFTTKKDISTDVEEEEASENKNEGDNKWLEELLPIFQGETQTGEEKNKSEDELLGEVRGTSTEEKLESEGGEEGDVLGEQQRDKDDKDGLKFLGFIGKFFSNREVIIALIVVALSALIVIILKKKKKRIKVKK